MNDKGRVLLALTGWDPLVWKRELQKHAPDREVVLEPQGEADPTIEYAVVWKQRPGLLNRLPNLKVVFSLGAGVDHIFHDTDLPDVPIARTVSPDLTMRMSEYVVWQVLDHHRHGARYRRQQTERVWDEIADQAAAHQITVGIMGLGELGQDAAMKLVALGFRVTGWSRTPRAISGAETWSGEDEFGRFLASANIFVVLLPLTPYTRGILNRETLARMSRRDRFGGPILINAGRGGLQVETDILSALEDGTLSAASLDVFGSEPLPQASPLWSHPRVTVTPHAAAASNPGQLAGPVIAQIEAFERGEPLAHLVDRKAGY